MREVMFTFRLDTILGLDLMNYRSPGSMPRRITMDERMRMQNLIGFLLGDGSEPFKTVHARLSVQAAFILVPINQQAELPRERRWMYVAWLMTRIVEDSAEDVLLDWPRLAQCLVKRFESEAQPPLQHLSEDMEERLANLPAHEQAPLRALMLGQITERQVRGKGESQLHHPVPDNVARDNPFFQETMKRGLFGMDEKPNIIEIAENDTALKKAQQMFKDGKTNTELPPLVHRGPHSRTDGETHKIIQEVLLNNRIREKDIPNLTDDQIKSLSKEIQNTLRDKYNKGDIPKKNGNQVAHAGEGKSSWA